MGVAGGVTDLVDDVVDDETGVSCGVVGISIVCSKTPVQGPGPNAV